MALRTRRYLVPIGLMALACLSWSSAADARRVSPTPPGAGAFQKTAGEQPAAAPLTQPQLAKIQKLIDAKRRKAVIDPKVANLLGLGKDGKPVVAFQLAVVEKDRKTRHIFDRLQDGSGFLVGKRTGDGFALYRLSNDLNTFSSVLWRADGNVVALRDTDAASGLRQELALWGRFADQQK